MSDRRMSTQRKSDAEKKPKFKSTDKIPVFAGAKGTETYLN